jgi:tetratricopeptide (TPR) repeat protein
VSKKKKHHHAGYDDPSDLRPRIDKAARDGRFQQALDLTKQLFKQEPSPVHRNLLHEMYLGRARQLREQGSTRDAANVLQVALGVGGPPAGWLEKAVGELILCGSYADALRIVSSLPDGEDLRAKILAGQADQAVLQEGKSRTHLSAELQVELDAVLKAFEHLAAGRDEAMKESLTIIGLRSPFLEWKLLLRGLQAYYTNDDVRALENWQRLSLERAPARLAAPYRLGLDESFRGAQSAKTRKLLEKQLTRLEGERVQDALRKLQKDLAGKKPMTMLLRRVEELLPDIQETSPQAVPRLAAFFYWALITDGNPSDIPRYQKVFRAPAEDPHFHRLQALGYEHHGDLAAAHKEWQKYLDEIPRLRDVWPGDQGVRVQALIWKHMGDNGMGIPDPADDPPDMPDFLRHHPDRPKPLKPSPEQCYRKSLELAPDQVATYSALFHYLLIKRKYDAAIATGQELLDRFPDHLDTLTTLAQTQLLQENYAAAVDLYQSAVRTNPLDRKLRQRLSTAHIYLARHYTEDGEFDEARAQFQAALVQDEQAASVVYCKWAACEFKAGDTARAEELLQQALAKEDSQLSVAYSMLIEVIRLKLPASLKKRFNDEFNTGLAAPATAAAAAALAETTGDHAAAGVTYHGQKTHQKKVTTYLTKAENCDFTEAQLERICDALRQLESKRLLRSYAEHARAEFPDNPVFCLILARAFMDNPYGGLHEASYLLSEGEKLARAQPGDPRSKEILAEIESEQQRLRLMNPFFSIFDEFGFDDFFGGADYDDDEEWID